MSSPQSLHSIDQRLSQRIQILLAGLLTGSAAATYPACGNILTDAGGFGFTSTQFGSLFVVQTLSAIASALLSPRFRTSTKLSRLTQAGLLATGLAMVLLVSIQIAPVTSDWPYFAALTSSLLMGIGIGLGISVANVSAVGAWHDNPRRGLTLLHTMLGLGLATSPLFVSVSISLEHWWVGPTIVGIGAMTLVFFVAPTAHGLNKASVGHAPFTVTERRLVVALGTLSFLYGVAEATFSNWCVIYLHEVSYVGLAAAGLVLSGFWSAVMLGRLAFSAVTPSRGRLLAVLSPIGMIVAFLLIALYQNAVVQIFGYLLAGLGCAAVYPALLGFSAQLPIHQSQFVSGVMVATVLAGTGTGTYLVAILNRWFGLGLAQIYLAFAVIPLSLIIGLWRIGSSGGKEKTQRRNFTSTVA